MAVSTGNVILGFSRYRCRQTVWDLCPLCRFQSPGFSDSSASSEKKGEFLGQNINLLFLSGDVPASSFLPAHCVRIFRVFYFLLTLPTYIIWFLSSSSYPENFKAGVSKFNSLGTLSCLSKYEDMDYVVLHTFCLLCQVSGCLVEAWISTVQRIF